MADLYNQTIRTGRWRLNLYPQHEDWGELFDLKADPNEHENRLEDPSLSDVVRDLAAKLRSEFPPRPEITHRSWPCGDGARAVYIIAVFRSQKVRLKAG